MGIKEKIAGAAETTWLLDSFAPEAVAENHILADTSTIIQRQRKSMGLSQKELAQRLGVSQGLVSRWENGEDNLTMETIARIAIALDLEVQSPLIARESIRHLEDIQVVMNVSFLQPQNSSARQVQWSVKNGA